MALYAVNTAFDWSGKQYRVGDLVEDNSTVYILFPARFSPAPVGALWISGSAAGTALGTVVKKVQVFDNLGTSLGYVPIYDAIT